jgi:type III pantothenate kinase
MGKDTKVIATGGLGSMIGTSSKYIKAIDDHLTLEGLRIIWERNSTGKPDSRTKPAKPTDSSKPSASAKSRTSSH